MQRESFVIFKNWVEAIEALPEENRYETFKALADYGLSGEMPENVSQITRALLCSFSAGVERNLERYQSRVENGKKGGRPKKIKKDCNKDKNLEETCDNLKTEQNLEKPRKTEQNLEKPNKTEQNLEKPNKTEQNLTVTDTDTITDTVTDTDTVSVSETVTVNDTVIDKQTVRQSINNKIYLSRLRGCEDKEKMKELFTENFKDFFPTRGYSEQNKRLFYEVIDVLITALLRARKGNFRFQMETIDEEKLLYYISLLDGESIFRVVWQLLCNDTIVKRPPYILGACFNLAKEKLANTG